MRKTIIIAILFTGINAQDLSNIDKFKSASRDLWGATKGIISDFKSEYIYDINVSSVQNIEVENTEVENTDNNKSKRVKRGFENKAERLNKTEKKEVSEFEGSDWSWAKLERYIKMEGEFKEDK